MYSPNNGVRSNNRANPRTNNSSYGINHSRPGIQQRPKVPPAVGSNYIRQSPGVNRTSNSPANRGNVFDRLSGNTGRTRPLREPVRKDVKKTIQNNSVIHNNIIDKYEPSN